MLNVDLHTYKNLCLLTAAQRQLFKMSHYTKFKKYFVDFSYNLHILRVVYFCYRSINNVLLLLKYTQECIQILK